MTRRRNKSKVTTNGHIPAPLMEHADDVILRSAQKISLQPERRDHFWYSTITMINEAGPMPAYDRSSIHRLDAWTRACLMKEPYLSGFVNKIVSAQANRGWSLYGGKRVVNSTAQMLHRFDPATIRFDDGRVMIDEFRSAGWRRANERKILSFLTRCAGNFTEIQYRLEPRFTRNGWSLSQVQNLYNMDTAKVEYTNDPLFPIRYDGSEDWPAASYYHLVSSPLDTQEFYNFGMSPLYRCIRLAQLMVNISDWEIGTLADDFVDVILLLNGATDEEFNAAMKARSLVQVNGNKAKRGAVLASTDPSMPLTADVLKLREKPASLDDFTGRMYMLLQGYAVNLGYALSHFMESPFGALLGRSGTEVDTAQRTTAESGGNDYHLKDQAALNQYVMPSGIEFLYDEQDIDDIGDAQVKAVRADTLRTLFLAERKNGESLGTVAQFQQQFVDEGIFPPEWTQRDEDVNVTDVEQVRVRERVLSSPGVHRFITGVESGEYRDDAIVRYRYNPAKDQHELRVVLESVGAMLEGQRRTVIMGNPKSSREINLPPSEVAALERELEKLPAFIDEQRRFPNPALVVKRVSDEQMREARRQMLKRKKDARAIAEVINNV